MNDDTPEARLSPPLQAIKEGRIEDALRWRPSMPRPRYKRLSVDLPEAEVARFEETIRRFGRALRFLDDGPRGRGEMLRIALDAYEPVLQRLEEAARAYRKPSRA